jgi:hypothetical protein
VSAHINYVWFGGDLGPLDKFNIYSWKALGHDVTVYASKWDTTAHNAGSLKLKDVDVEDLYTHITKDKNAHLPKTRELLLAWLEAAKKDPPKKVGTDIPPHVFNVGDLSKTYIAASQAGIVLDLKVGPSPHVAAYLDCLDAKFVSYTRGAQTAERPENQCAGTVKANALRDAYAKGFELAATAKQKDSDPYEGYKSAPTGSHFDKITGWHGKGSAAAKFVDTALKGPDGQLPKPDAKSKLSPYVVREIAGENGHGPFRVFKRAKDQTNKPSSVPTTKKDQWELADWVLKNELKKATVEEKNKKFLTEVENAFAALPKS